MITKQLKSLVAAAILGAAAMGTAQAQELKIGYVNSERVLREAAPAKAALARMEADFGKRDRELNEQGAKLKAAADKLEKDAPTLSEGERNRRQRELHTDWLTRVRYLPFLMSVGIGLAVNNTRAVFEALFNKQSEFARTPKYRIEGQSDEWISKKYRQAFVVQPMIELALGLYFTATVFYALANGIYGTLPFLMLFQFGFLYMGLMSILQQFRGEDLLEKAAQTAGGK